MQTLSWAGNLWAQEQNSGWGKAVSVLLGRFLSGRRPAAVPSSWKPPLTVRLCHQVAAARPPLPPPSPEDEATTVGALGWPLSSGGPLGADPPAPCRINRGKWTQNEAVQNLGAQWAAL